MDVEVKVGIFGRRGGFLIEKLFYKIFIKIVVKGVKCVYI